MASLADLVVFSNLRWDFVVQRPQHVLSRIARTRPVTLVEEPMLDEHNAPRLEITQVDEKLVVVRPNMPIKEPGFDTQWHESLMNARRTQYLVPSEDYRTYSDR